MVCMECKTDFKEMEASFKVQVSEKVGQVDPDGEEDWSSLALGFGLAKSMTPKIAREFALHIRYHTELG